MESLDLLKEEILRCLKGHSRITLKRGERLYNKSCSLVFSDGDGRLALAKDLHPDRRVIIDFYGSGGHEDLVYLGFLDDTTYLESVDKPISVVSWPESALQLANQSHPELYMALLRWVLRRQDAVYADRMAEMSWESIEGRVRRMLIRLAATGTRTPEGIVVQPTSHELMSDYIATSREIVTFHMNQIKRKGLIRYSRKRGITILDLNELAGKRGASA